MAVFAYIKTQYDINSPIDKQKILNTLFGLVQKINNISLQQHYIQAISDQLHSPFEFTRSQYKQYSKNEQKNHRQKPQNSSIYQPSRELLLAALFYNNFFEQHQETPDMRSSLIAIKELLINAEGNNLIETIKTEDSDAIKILNELQLRREKEFDLKTEDKKIQVIKQTI